VVLVGVGVRFVDGESCWTLVVSYQLLLLLLLLLVSFGNTRRARYGRRPDESSGYERR